ncbi:hypothetical protein DFH28DRAFT_1117014 [Melampsora americana]|nr:hypothetical protein DFH28DRAFT_1117014 [Melampsora americana]
MSSAYLSPSLVHHQWHSSLVAPPKSHEDLKKAFRTKLDHLMGLPEQSLPKIYEELAKMETGCYSLIPIQNAVVKEGQWKLNFELEEEEEGKEAERETKEAEREAKKACTSTSKGSRCTAKNQKSQASSPSKTEALKASKVMNNLSLSHQNSALSSTGQGIQGSISTLTTHSLPHTQETTQQKQPIKCSCCKVPGHCANYCPSLNMPPVPNTLPEDDVHVNNENECPFRDEPLPLAPSKQLLRMKATLFALPNVMSSPFPQTAEFSSSTPLTFNKTAPFPPKYFICRVLVPKLATLLIAKDLDLPPSDPKVGKTLQTSKAFGNAIFSIKYGKDCTEGDSNNANTSNDCSEQSLLTSTKDQSILSQIPGFIVPYINGTFDPPALGNCGYYAIAEALGTFSEDSYWDI